MSFSNNFPTTGPSLELDFANVGALDPRITFTRSSIATVTNSLGLLQTVQANVPRFDYDPVTLAPRGLLIEEQRTNLLTYSEQFDNAYWSKAGPAADTYQGTGLQAVVTANQGIAPDGTLTADRLILDLNGGTTTNDRSGFSTSVTVSTALTYTSTLYIKPLDGTTQSQLESSSNIGALSAGGTATQRYATPVGNGWFRLVQVIQPVNTSGTWRVQLVGGVPGAPAKIDCLIWGAQLEAGSFATSYVPSTQTFTGRTSTGTFIGSNGLIQTAGSGVARMQYNPLNLSVAPFLLLEAAATNLFTNSDFNSGVSGTGLVTSSTMTGPTGATITAAAFGHDGTTTSFLYKNTVAATTQYAISVFVRMDDGNAPVFGSLTATSPLNDFALVVSGGAVPVSTYTVENFGGGLYRVSGSVISQATNLGNNGVIKYSTNSNRTFKTSGWQVEANAFPTSYIPTVATTGNRSADTSTSAATQRNADNASMTGTAFSSWFNQTEGTFYVNFSSLYSGSPSGATPRQLALTPLAGASGFVSYWSNAVVTSFDGTNSASANIGVSNWIGPHKIASAYGASTKIIYANGATLGSGAYAGTWASATGLTSAPAGHILKIAYYPVRLSNTNLQALTL